MFNLTTEKYFFSQGVKLIGALDEAGRGPLAGPVAAACVLVRPDFVITKDLQDVRDSKKLSEKKREELFDIIMSTFPEIGVGLCEADTIDRINILQASFLAMKKALSALKSKPDFLILDGKLPIPNSSFRQKPIIKGDSLVFSIAAASIVAKVTRDRIMRAAHEKYPQYNFLQHKGYGTKAHFEALRLYGACPLHRQSFQPVKDAQKIKKCTVSNLEI